MDFQPAPASYYLGQNLQYRQLLVDRGYTRLQDFYTNPAFNTPRQVNIICATCKMHISIVKNLLAKTQTI